MRFLNKYKLYEKRISAKWKIPTRVLKFKRPKWKVIKRKIRTRRIKWAWIEGKKHYYKWVKGCKHYYTRVGPRNRKLCYKWVDDCKVFFRPKYKYENHLNITMRKRFFAKKFFRFKQGLRTYVSSLFEKSIKFKKTTTAKDRHSVVSSFLIKPFYRIDILLWYLEFFHTSIESRKFINARNVCVNGKVVGPNYELKRGDIVTLTFDETLLAWLNLCNASMFYRYKKSRHFFPFIEYDFYTHTIVVLKDWNELSGNEMSLTFKKNKNKLKYTSYR